MNNTDNKNSAAEAVKIYITKNTSGTASEQSFISEEKDDVRIYRRKSFSHTSVSFQEQL